MDRGAWWTTVHGMAKESDTTEQPKQQQNNQYLLPELIFPSSLTFPKSPS